MTMNNYISLPPKDPSYLYKVYSIRVNGKEVSRNVGIKQAMGKSKWLKYRSFTDTVALYNAYTNQLVKQFGN